MTTMPTQPAAAAEAAVVAGLAEDDGQDLDQYLTFGLAGEMFAVGVHRVREVLDLPRLARVANAPPALLGMIDVRGVGIPVIDLKAKLALPSSEPTEHSRIVVLEIAAGGQQLVVGALTDAVFEVTSLAVETIEPPPRFGQAWDSAFMRGMARLGGRFVTLLDLDRVFGADELDQLQAGNC